MINNRQNGRRRGRGGQQVRSGQPGMPDRGSRVDNRARGNAAQLLEKYKSLARDAQMQGDRVNTEYYLQFADHYFRVLSENRSRFEEQRPDQQQRARHENYRDDMGDGNRDDGDEDGGDDRQRGYDGQGNGWDGDDGDGGAPEQNRYEARRDEPRRDEPRREEGRRDEPRRDEPRRDEPRRDEPRRDEPRREEPRRERVARDASPAPEATRPIVQDEGERYQERRPRRARNSRPPEGNADAVPVESEAPVAERIEVDRLPQGFGTAPAAETASEDGAERPRRRAPRRPRTDAPAVEL